MKSINSMNSMRKMFFLNYHKNKKLSYLVLIVFLCLFAASSGQAKNLGVWGTLFPVEEQDIREFIYQRLNEMEQNGEMSLLNKKFTQNVKEHALRPTPVAGLTVIENTKKSEIFYY